MAKKLLIIIPTYKQIDLARRCLAALAKQTYTDFSVTIQDDGNDADYRTLPESFPTLDCSYRSNPVRLGAIRNIISGLLAETASEFLMVMHEDDSLQPEYLGRAISLLETKPELALVGSPAEYFHRRQEPRYRTGLSRDWRSYDYQELASYLTSLNKFVFGSAVYRRASLHPDDIELEKYSVFFDRPFLIQTLRRNGQKAALLQDRFYLYQEHPFPDKRFDDLQVDHILNLYSLYHEIIPGRYLSSQLLYDFAALKNKSWREFPAFWKEAERQGLLDHRQLSYKFVGASLFIFFFGKKNYHRLFVALKKISKQRQKISNKKSAKL
jgi:glycosyltransferase involved in cell wall biosynthesis